MRRVATPAGCLAPANLLVSLGLVLGSACTAVAAIAIEGLTDRMVAGEPVRFRPVAVDGYEDTASLDQAPVPLDGWIQVDRAGYHEFLLTRTALAGGATETGRFRFVILAAGRGTTEVGLPPWTPRPWVPSAPGEFAEAQLRLIAPRTFPSDLPLPVIAWVQGAHGKRVGVNGAVEVAGRSPTATGLILRRGIGSAFLPVGDRARDLALGARIHGLSVNWGVTQDGDTPWQEVVGDILEPTTWAAQGRRFVPSNLTVRAGATLKIEAGTVVLLGPKAEIHLEGTLDIQGTVSDPVVFLPRDRGSPWGGFVLLGAPARVEATGALFTGAGADARFYLDRSLGGGHRAEQPVFHLGPGVRAVFTDCWFVDLSGQALHGEDADLTLERCLVQRCLTVGQFNGGSVQVRDSALIEFPVDDSRFLDEDNDAIYLTRGIHRFSDTLIGWTKDDGIDAGGDSPGEVHVERCWIESCFHEGMALSGTDKIVAVLDSVFLNNGQGVEAGYLSPRVTVENSLLAGNEVGARFGDNYGSAGMTHAGFLRVTNSFLLNNGRDTWGMVLPQWSEAVDRMDLEGNSLSRPHPAFPRNALWDGDRDGAALGRFRNPATSVVGLGFLTPDSRLPNAAGTAEVLVGLSAFSDREVRVECRVEDLTTAADVDYQSASHTLRFAAGEMVQAVRIETLANPARRFSTTARLVLERPQNAAFAAPPAVHRLRFLVASSEGDRDADGLPDDWEEALVNWSAHDAITHIQEVHPDEDFDGDGSSNQDEYRAGTDATNPEARLELRVKASSSAEVMLEFDAVPGRAYRVEAARALGRAPGWQPLIELAPSGEAGPRAVAEIIPPGATAGFYRLVVLP